MSDTLKKQIADKLLALLEDNLTFAALVKRGKLGNQATTGWLKVLIERSVADFPRVDLTNGRFTSSGYIYPAATFGNEAANDDPESILQRRIEFKLTITGRDLKSVNIDPTEEAAQTAILSGGRFLGLGPSIVGWGPMTAEQKEINDAGTRRLQSIITIPVFTEQRVGDVIT